MRPRSDLLLLLLAAGCLLFGGGIGCQPELEGVTFRATSVLTDPEDRFSPRDWFMAFTGKKAPGQGIAILPYPLEPPFGISARMGVFREELLAASANAEGCVGLRRTGPYANSYALCVSYQTAPANLHVRIGGAASADCPGVARAELELELDETTVTARYRCNGDDEFSTLDTSPSIWAEGDRWEAFVEARNLGSGGQVAFDDLRIESEPPAETHGDVAAAFQTFDAFRLGLEAFYHIESDEFEAASSKAGQAHAKIGFAISQLSDEAAASAGKLLTKAEKGHAKLLDVFRLQKGFAKVAASDADALEALTTSD